MALPLHTHAKLLFYPLLASFFCFSFPQCHAQEIEKLFKTGITEGIIVDLREPTYADGVVTTDKGGVITGPHLRIQAIHLSYSRKSSDDVSASSIEASGDLIVEFGEYVFVGEKLIYDFQEKRGIIYNGRTAVGPWYFGGEQLELRPDGSYVLYNGYATTSEKDIPDWGVYSGAVVVESDRYLKATQLQVKILNFPILWVPSLRANLDSIFDTPIRYRVRCGGNQGPRFGITYEIFSWERWKTFVRFDYRLTRGPGGGLETRYRSLDRKTEFQSISYLAKDSAVITPHEKSRYRFEGIFRKAMDDNKTKVLFSYDKISDRDMPGSYYDNDFAYTTSERTQLLIRREEENWIGNFYTRVRVNSFQTVKQELPTLEMNFKPYEFKHTGLIIDQQANASYLNFEYSKNLEHVHGYASSRFEYRPSLYRPFAFGQFFTLTPEIGGVAILYGNSPEKDPEYLGLGIAGFDLKSQLYRFYGSLKHVIEPYTNYRYYSSPTSSPHQHYIFDISDGWTRLNYLTFGVRNAFFAKKCDSCVSRVVSADLYSYAYFDQHKMRQTIPRVYGDFVFVTSPTLRYTLDMAWDLEHDKMYYYNFRTDWTYSADFALAAEYRHRDSYSWRKVDPDNFFLDLFHSEKRLHHSSLSDRRDTVLLHLFYRFHPNWALEASTRQGWNRKREPSYVEYELNLLTTIQSAWNIRFALEHREIVTRVAMYVNVGLKRPDVKRANSKPYCYD